MKSSYFSVFCCLLVVFVSSAFCLDIPVGPQPEELGDVNWLRDYDQAISASRNTQKPILILFQEVPGCSTCRGYGNDVLSHPLIVEAIEELFIPLAIHNNKSGKDKKILDLFGEPSWNNPVVRIIDKHRSELTSRISGKYDRRSLVLGMVAALEKAKKPIPQYLKLLKAHLSATMGTTQKATFGMYCFWSGEAKLGSLPGVVHSEPGFMGGSEVVSVTYNPEVTSYKQLLTAASEKKSYDQVFTHSARQKEVAKDFINASKLKDAQKFRADGQPKYYLLHSPYRLIPMLPNQASQINTVVGLGGDPNLFLSPKQLELLSYMKANPGKGWKNVYGQPFLDAWNQVIDKI